eukprot:m.329598 g.329598  ORF g.329598 m.329598 type:complete len:330 (-) comp16510_c0_seq4:1130-2119(-)
MAHPDGPPPGMLATPPLLLGTMEGGEAPQPDPTTTEAVQKALAAGITGFDSAELYTTAKDLAAGLTAAKDPAAIFLCTKIRGLSTTGVVDADEDYAAIKAKVTAHLGEIGVGKVQLLLMHWPGPAECDLTGSPDAVAALATWDFFESNIDRAWQNMLRLREEGLCEHVGVSNVYKPAFDRLVAGLPPGTAEVNTPAANQIFIDPTHPEFEYVAALQAAGVKVLGYRPLAFAPHIEMAAQMGDETWGKLTTAAAEAGAADVRQFILGWLVKRGITPVVKTLSHADANLAAASLPDHPHYSSTDLFARSELVDMCGGGDEFAAVFCGVAPP